MDRRKRIGILVGQAEEEYQDNFIGGFLEKVFAYDFDVCVFAMYQRFQESPAREIGESSIFSLLNYDQFDAMVLMLDTIQTPGVAQKLEEEVYKRFKGPVLCVDVESTYFPYIEMDYYVPMKKIIAHLIEHHGYTDIAFVTGWKGHKHAMQRLQAFRDCMAEHNLPVEEDWIYYGDFWYNGGEQLVEKLIKQGGKMPQAIACANDYMAIGAGKMLAKYGLHVPEDVALCGYDSVEAGTNSPQPVTSAPLSPRSYGRYAGECMLALFEGKELPAFEDDTKLFIGSSCGCHSESVVPKVLLRERWDTDMSERAFYSANNHMNEDMLCQTNFYDLMRIIRTYTYQIQDFDEFHICLNEDWNDFEKKAREGRQDEIYSNRMLHVLRCYKDASRDVHCFDNYFLKEEMLPVIYESHEKPRVYFFTPLHFEEKSFGYAVLCYENINKSYSSTYRMWLRSVMQQLECFRRIEAIQRSNEMLEASMTRDVLTGLFNYNGFLKQSDQLVRKILRTGANVGALAIDIKELMKINEVYGRAEGDRTIIAVAHTLRDVFQEAMNVCFGNGEMVTILVSDRNVEEALQQGYDRMIEQIAEYYQSGDTKCEVEIHYGIEVGNPHNHEELERLVNVAVSKKNGNKVSERKMVQGEKLSEEELKEAHIVQGLLDRNDFKYHFQPIVNAKTGDIFGYEALMRPDVEPYMAPPQVLKYAEYYDRLYDVERLTFFNVLDIVNQNRHIFNGRTKIFINSIPGQLLREEEAKRLEEIAARLKNTVVVELTEQQEMTDDELATLKEYYNKIGFMTAIDDYGTGYSNVTNLLRYMPNCVKIDRMLLSNIQDSPQKQHFVKDIITFSHDSNIVVLAEGVETSAELQMVIQLGVDLIQGYYTGRPGRDIVTSISKNVKNEIIEFNRTKSYNRGRRVYVSGKESRISLARLVAEKYAVIEITDEETSYRDVTISGVLDMETEIYLRVRNGYKGRIVLDNVTLQGSKHGASIDIGNDCEVTLVLQGENRCMYGGIRVQPGSKLTVEGDGTLAITVDSANYFGIGNDVNANHGELIFNQDGMIEIKGSGMKGVAIGSGLGGNIRIQRGKYLLRLIGQDGVGIGSLTGDVSPVVLECDMHIDIATERAIGIGSLSGNVQAHLERLVYMGEFNADDVMALGTLEGKKSCIEMKHVNLILNSRAYRMCGVGAYDGDVSIQLSEGAVMVTGAGTGAIGWGNFLKTASVKMRSAKMDCKVRSELDSNVGTEDKNVHLHSAEYHYILNGAPIILRDNTPVNHTV